MILFNEPWAWWAIYGIAVAAGAAGGLVAELLLRGAAGQIEKPRKLANFLDLGVWANVIVGAVAAMASLLFLQPDTAVVNLVEVEGYTVRALIGLSLIIGSAGGAVIAALQQNVVAALKAAQVQNVTQAAKAEIAQIKAEVVAGNGVPEATFARALRNVEEAGEPLATG